MDPLEMSKQILSDICIKKFFLFNSRHFLHVSFYLKIYIGMEILRSVKWNSLLYQQDYHWLTTLKWFYTAIKK